MVGWWVAMLVGVGLLAGYGAALRRRPTALPRWHHWHTAAWVAGALAVAVALSPPLGEPAHHDHRLHMAQHLLLGMYAPLGLALGAPVTLLLGSLSRRGKLGVARLLRSRPFHVLAHPATAALLNVGGMFALYLTPLYAVSVTHPVVHAWVLAHFMAAGYLYVWAIAGPDPAPRRPGMKTRVAVLVIAAGAHAFLAKLLYAKADVFGGGHESTANMQAAAQWMYYGGDGAEVLLAVMLFAWWYRRRRASTMRPFPVVAT